MLDSADLMNFHYAQAKSNLVEGHPASAMASFLEITDYYKERKDSIALSYLYDDLAFVNQKLRQHDDHLRYAEIALEQKQKTKQMARIGRTYTLLGNYYFYNDFVYQYPPRESEAERYYRSGLKNSEPTSNFYADNLVGLANCYFQLFAVNQNNVHLADSTERFLKGALIIYNRNENNRGAIYVHQTYFQYVSFIESLKTSKAEKLDYRKQMHQHLDKSKMLLKVIRDTELQLNQTKSESYMMEVEGRFKDALNLKKLHYDLALRYNSNTNIERVQFLEETFKRDTTVRALANNGLILQLANEKANRQRDLSLIIGLVLLVFIILLYFYFQNRLQKRKLENVKSVLESQESERKRIAQDLHDGVGVLITGVQRQLETLETVSEEELANTSELVSEVANEIRKAAHDMTPGNLTSLGLKDSLEDLFSRVYSEHLEIQMDMDFMGERIGKESELTIYRIIQELLNNTLKYAQASKIKLVLENTESEFKMYYQDNGKGFDKEGVFEGIGLKSIYSRTDILSGKVNIETEPNQGFSAYFIFPTKRLLR